MPRTATDLWYARRGRRGQTQRDKVADARRPTAHPRRLAEYARDPDPEVRRVVARNPRTEPGTLDRLAKDRDRETRRAVAAHPHVHADTLSYLARDRDSRVRFEALRNATLPVDVMKDLLPDPTAWPGLRENPALPEEFAVMIALSS